MKFIDSHCHFDFRNYDESRDQDFELAQKVGVETILVPGVSPKQWPKLAELRAKYSGVQVAVGIHPQELSWLSNDAIKLGIESLAENAKAMNAVAIGECGYDKPTEKNDKISLDAQSRIVDAHLEVAKSLGLPLVVHILDAHGFALERLRRHGPRERAGVIHHYSGPVDMLAGYQKLGFAISFGPSISLPNARKPLEALRATKADRLLFETDGPDNFLHGDASRTGRPADVVKVYEIAAKVRGEELEALTEQVAQNHRVLFGG